MFDIYIMYKDHYSCYSLSKLFSRVSLRTSPFLLVRLRDEILCEVICGHDADAAHSSRAEESESCKFGDAQQVIGEEVAGPTQKHKD